MKHILPYLLFSVTLFTLNTSCKKNTDEEVTTSSIPQACVPKKSFNAGSSSGPRLIFKFKFDNTQTRLDNFGQPSTVPSGNAAQSPIFNLLSQHYIELANTNDALGAGTVLYVGKETNKGGSKAIDYCASTATGDQEIFFSKPLSEITPGTYEWLRVSLAYQNYDITYKANAIPGDHLGSGTLASFIGFKTYISGYQINGKSYIPGAAVGGPGNHTQGYWGFLTKVYGKNYFSEGEAGSTTVPNPLFNTSPIPAGSCVVTGQFNDNTMNTSPLTITGSETSDIVIIVSLSTNNSFEWQEVTADGYYQPEIGETVVDMGIRGMIPIKE
jgi:hypothetical protein